MIRRKALKSSTEKLEMMKHWSKNKLKELEELLAKVLIVLLLFMGTRVNPILSIYFTISFCVLVLYIQFTVFVGFTVCYNRDLEY